jgi:hypothetical protein
MRVSGVLLGVFVAVAGCVDGAPPPAARVEPVASFDGVLFRVRAAAFDPEGSLVISDGNSGLFRLRDGRFRRIPGSEAFAFGNFGYDRDRALLVAGAGAGVVARLPSNDVFSSIGPPVPESADTPIGTLAGNIYVRALSAQRQYVLLADAAEWTVTDLDLHRALHAPDGQVYAIHDGDIVRLAADDRPAPIASCTAFGGGACGALELAGFDAEGQLVMAAEGAASLQVLDAVGTLRDVDLPGELVVHRVCASSRMTALVARDRSRMELSLWLVAPDDRFSRITTVPFPTHLVADPAGAVFLVDGLGVSTIVLD